MRLAQLGLVLGFAIAGLAACGRSTFQSSRGDVASRLAAVSNRPQNYDRIIVTIKLPSPPLLRATKTDAAAIQSIEREQAELEGELKGLSPEIQVLSRYRLVLNAMTLAAPKSLAESLLHFPGLAFVEANQVLERPKALDALSSPSDPDATTSSPASFIGAPQLRKFLQEQNSGALRPLRIGIIDTGIDYTHAMLGGSGRASDYKQQDRSSLDDGGFPNAIVAGGYDFVGSDFDAGSPRFEQHIPKPDPDPLDESGHGTHVAGIIAGHGLLSDSHDGVVPDAQLYALKVFGAHGNTDDAIVLAALEYAADPDQDLDPIDHLDLVNLSFGTNFGTVHALYNEALDNLAAAGLLVVAAAGNSGDIPNIVGVPATSDKALAVTASVDAMPHNWSFRAVEFGTAAGASFVTQAIEAAISRPIDDARPVSAPLVYLGTASQELSPSEKAALQGKVALVDRGGGPLADKFRRVTAAGALGLVVANNQAGQPSRMAGDGFFDLYAIMISQDLGQQLKKELQEGEVLIHFVSKQRIEKPALIDTLASFSSRGPRALDGLLKPEIAAPGQQILSAHMGSGTGTVMKSGTSMAAPFVAGVLGLLRLQHPTLSLEQLKSLLLSTARPMQNEAGQAYSLAQVGAGRIQALAAGQAELAFAPASLSLGEQFLVKKKSFKRSLQLSNISQRELTISLDPQLDPGLSVSLAGQGDSKVPSFTIQPGQTKSLQLRFTLAPDSSGAITRELDGFLNFRSSDGALQRVPVLALLRQNSLLRASNEQTPWVRNQILTLRNDGFVPGRALVFHPLGQDERKTQDGSKAALKACDLESAAWRQIVETRPGGAAQRFLEFAIKLYAPLSNWTMCEISIQIDRDGDGQADQELLGTSLSSLSGNPKELGKLSSVLTDAGIMRAVRHAYELEYPYADPLQYTGAILDRQSLRTFDHATLALVRVDLGRLDVTTRGELQFKVMVQGDASLPEADDYLENDKQTWRTLRLDDEPWSAALADISLAAGASQSLDLRNFVSSSEQPLVIYMPDNPVSWSSTQRDAQALLLDARPGS